MRQPPSPRSPAAGASSAACAGVGPSCVSRRRVARHLVARRRVVLPAVALAAAVIASPAARADAPAPADRTSADPPGAAGRGALSLVFENDVFLDLDRHYTNGVQLIWTSAPAPAPAWGRGLARRIPGLSPDARVRATAGLGQSMYTPEDISLADPPPGARPYAGWLYGSAGVTAQDGPVLHRLQLTLGIVGPSSLAGETQRFVHDLTGSPQPQGWDTQLDDEPGAVLAYQRSWRARAADGPAGFSTDLVPHAGFALGNVFTYGELGTTVRVGRRLPDDYGPPRVQLSLPGSGFFEPDPSGDFGWYLFGGVAGRAVARNIFLDGNTFGGSRSVDREVLVGDLQLGVAIAFNSVRITYTHVFRTREFREQSGGDRFGAIAVSVRF